MCIMCYFIYPLFKTDCSVQGQTFSERLKNILLNKIHSCFTVKEKDTKKKRKIPILTFSVCRSQGDRGYEGPRGSRGPPGVGHKGNKVNFKKRLGYLAHV